MTDSDFMESMISQVISNASYASISPDLIRWVVLRESQVTRKPRELVQRVRSKLHQTAAAFQAKAVPYSDWIQEVEHLPHQMDTAEVKDFCHKALKHHSSTIERFSILEDFYSQVFTRIGPVHSLYDFACGLNPLALPWMGLPPDVHYFGCDIFTDQVNFLNLFLNHVDIKGHIDTINLASSIPSQPVDAALLLKTLPCLEQLDRTIGSRLLHAVNAPLLIVSFPVASLGGRQKGMQQHYESHLMELLEKSWTCEKLIFSTEMVFIIRK